MHIYIYNIYISYHIFMKELKKNINLCINFQYFTDIISSLSLYK